MCEQCLTWPVSFGEPLPGFFLMRARRQGNDWNKGEWGLVECNDPTFCWKTTPRQLAGEDDESARYDDLFAPEEFRDALYCDPETGYRLIQAAMTKGYDPETSGGFGTWFFDYLGRWLQTAEMIEESDPFPNREKFAPVDLTIGREPHPIETS